jgi:hypothetical protein
MQIFLPTALDHYRSAMVPLPAPDEPIEVFLFGSRTEWLGYTRERLPQEAAMYEKIGRGGYTVEGDAVLYDIGRWDTFTIASHEGWHAYTQRVFRHSLPVWLEEGIACYMEGVRGGVDGAPPTFIPWRNFERFGELRDVVARNRLIPLEELVQGTPQDALANGRTTLLGYYAQVWALGNRAVSAVGLEGSRCCLPAPHGGVRWRPFERTQSQDPLLARPLQPRELLPRMTGFPLKPVVPALDQQRASPLLSVMVTVVLLNVALMWAMPTVTLRRTFLRLLAAFAALAADACLAMTDS